MSKHPQNILFPLYSLLWQSHPAQFKKVILLPGKGQQTAEFTLRDFDIFRQAEMDFHYCFTRRIMGWCRVWKVENISVHPKTHLSISFSIQLTMRFFQKGPSEMLFLQWQAFDGNSVCFKRVCWMVEKRLEPPPFRTAIDRFAFRRGSQHVIWTSLFFEHADSSAAQRKESDNLSFFYGHLRAVETSCKHWHTEISPFIRVHVSKQLPTETSSKNRSNININLEMCFWPPGKLQKSNIYSLWALFWSLPTPEEISDLVNAPLRSSTWGFFHT